MHRVTAAAPAGLIWFLGALIAIGPLSLDAYLPAMPAMAETFGVQIVALNNTISVYLVGYGISQFLGGTFSDQIGRKRIGLIGLAVFVFASIAISSAQTIQQAQFWRFVQALGGGFSTVICMAIIRDVYPIRELGRRMAMMTLIMLASPVIAPALGAAEGCVCGSGGRCRRRAVAWYRQCRRPSHDRRVEGPDSGSPLV